MFLKKKTSTVLEHSTSIFWTSICTSVTNGFEASRRAGSRVVRVHLQVQSDGLLQFADMRIGPMGGCWRWKCAAHSCFFHSLPWEVRRWGDKLLTTLRNLPHNPPFATGVQHWWEEKPRLASHRLTSPCFWTSLTLPASLLPAQHLAFKFSPPTPPPPSQPSTFLSEWQRSLRVVYLQQWRFEAYKECENQHLQRFRWDLLAGICWLH